jgi:AcrR family transcriptional regulator
MQSTNRERILLTGLRHFVRLGFDNTSLHEIATECGLPISEVTRLFPTKDELLKDIAVRGYQQIRQAAEVLRDSHDPIKALQSHIANFKKELIDNTEFWRNLHHLRLEPDMVKRIGPLAFEIVDESFQLFTEAFRTLGFPAPEIESILFTTQIDGIASLYLVDPHIPLDAICEQLIQRYAAKS